MAVMIGNVHHAAEHVHFTEQPIKWLGNKLNKALGNSRYNPSPFPDRVWSRHSALLDSAWKTSRRNRG